MQEDQFEPLKIWSLASEVKQETIIINRHLQGGVEDMLVTL